MNFNVDAYQKANTSNNTGKKFDNQKIGFFKLKAEGSAVLVRFNVSSISDLQFANVHKPVFGKKFEGLGTGLTPVSCLNPVGNYSDNCPFCKAAREGNETIGKAGSFVYLQMMVAYIDPASGAISKAAPVIWERPAGYYKELAAKLNDYGDLKAHVFKITRFGSGKDTRYSMDYIPIYDKPETVTDDFSAFNNFKVNKHSYWEKTAEELQFYVDNEEFPAAEKEEEEAPKTVAEVINKAMPTAQPAAEAVSQPPFMAPQYANVDTSAVSATLDTKVTLASEAPAEPVGNVIAEAEALLAQAQPAAQPAQAIPTETPNRFAGPKFKF